MTGSLADLQNAFIFVVIFLMGSSLFQCYVVKVFTENPLLLQAPAAERHPAPPGATRRRKPSHRHLVRFLLSFSPQAGGCIEIYI